MESILFFIRHLAKDGMKNLITLVFSFALPFTQMACGPMNQKNQERKELIEPKVVNFKTQFDLFWKQAKGQDFERQVDLWTSIIEVQHQFFFDSFVWSQKDDPAFSARRSKQLKTVFDRIEKNENKIMNDLQVFESVLALQMKRYRDVFTDAEFPVTCYGVVGGNFLGRVGTDPKTKERILAFGIDKMADMQVNPDIIYSHELFHVYHGTKSDIDSDGRMITQLWAEGLASFASHELNPNASKKDVFIYESAAGIKDDQLPRISSLFLKVADQEAFDPKDGQAYFDWFLSEKGKGSLPAMAGYWLGYKVVAALRNQHSLDEMSRWNAEKAGQMVHSTLMRFNDNAG